jgi:tRNA/tmRNA/rRNA uracil-C5-methylase (TrmA/RlmC/RlmD family)
LKRRDASETACPHRPPCSGCPRYGEPDIAPAAKRALDELARAHGLPEVEVFSGSSAGFRLRARLAIRGRVGSPKLGLFELGSHRVVHIPSCRVQHPLINRVASVVRRALAEARVTSYSDKARTGIARYLQVVVERASQSAQVVMVGHSPTAEPLAECFSLIRERLGSDLHSLWFNANLEPTNTIMGPMFENVCGPAAVIESFGGPDIHYPPGAFGQSNLEIAERIIAHVRERIPEEAHVAEFYAGVGAIGLSVLERVREIRINEVSAQSLQGLALGIEGLEPAERRKVSVFQGPAASALDTARAAQVVIVDPPRKGLDVELKADFLERPPERLLYVSCGLTSLLADISELTAAGTMRLAELTAFNLMPFTGHVETVARLERC